MADENKCSPQERRNEAQEFVELGTTPNIDTKKYGPIPLDSPEFSCLTDLEKRAIVGSLLNDALSGKDISTTLGDAEKIIHGLPNMANSPNAQQNHPPKKGWIEL